MLIALQEYYVKLHDLRTLTTIKQFVTAGMQNSGAIQNPDCLPEAKNTCKESFCY